MSRKFIATSAVGLMLIVGSLTACAAASDELPATAETSADQGSTIPREPYTSAVDVGKAPLTILKARFAIDVEDPRVVLEHSSTVVAGTVIGIVGTEIDALGIINTIYHVRVDETFKGVAAPGEEINISLPGGTMMLGEYISILDEREMFDRFFPVKSEEFMREKGIDPEGVDDPREMDPATPVTHNLESNPASESALADLAPDAWIFFLDRENEEEPFFGSVLSQSLKYQKGGTVRNIIHERGDGETGLSVEELRELGAAAGR